MTSELECFMIAVSDILSCFDFFSKSRAALILAQPSYCAMSCHHEHLDVLYQAGLL